MQVRGPLTGQDGMQTMRFMQAHPRGLRMRIVWPNEAAAAALSWLLAWRLRCAAAIVVGGGSPDAHHCTSAAAELRPRLQRRYARQHGGHLCCLRLHDFLKRWTPGYLGAYGSLADGLMESMQMLSAVLRPYRAAAHRGVDGTCHVRLVSQVNASLCEKYHCPNVDDSTVSMPLNGA